jgi:hypothetical protein
MSVLRNLEKSNYLIVIKSIQVPNIYPPETVGSEPTNSSRFSERASFTLNLKIGPIRRAQGGELLNQRLPANLCDDRNQLTCHSDPLLILAQFYWEPKSWKTMSRNGSLVRRITERLQINPYDVAKRC